MKPIITLLALIVAMCVLPGTSFATAGNAQAKAEQAQPTKEKELAEEWIVGFIAKHAPPGRKTYYADAQETKEEALKRYHSIARDIIEVVYNPETKPLFGGAYGRARTVTVILGIMLFESGFGRHVDFGVGKFARGDHGNSYCLMQMNVGQGRAWGNAGGWNVVKDRPWRYGDKAEDLVKGATGPEMVADRRKCITEGLRLLKISFHSCRGVPLKEKLLVYASGKCSRSKEAVKGSRLRMTAAVKFWEETRDEWRQFKDEPVKQQLVVMLEKRAQAEALAAKQKAAKDAAKQAETEGKSKPEAKAPPKRGGTSAKAKTAAEG